MFSPLRDWAAELIQLGFGWDVVGQDLWDAYVYMNMDECVTYPVNLPT